MGIGGDVSIQIADSITKLGPEFSGAVLVAGSHGGRYCGYLAALAGLRGVILNDAGVGLDKAGLGSLEYLQPLGVAAATVSNSSARIGDGADMVERGRISHCNQVARELGCEVGQTCDEAAECMSRGQTYTGDVPAYEESRAILKETPVRVIACDSAALVESDDAGAIIITGSHGGVLAGRPGYGIAAQAHGAVFNDAGFGIDQAGIQRLSVLEQAGIPAVTVDAATARIGDARSAWESGVISGRNALAADRGVAIGASVPEFVEMLSS